MKLQKLITTGIATALAMACSTARMQAQTVITNTFTFTFDNGGATAPFNSTWIYWYNSPGGNAPISCDPTTDASNPVAGANTSGSGSLMVVSPLAGYTQDVFFGTFASNINNAYDFSTVANTTYYSNVSFDILVAPGTPTNSSGNYGTIQVGFINLGYGQENLTASPATIPASASSAWYHVSVPIDQTQGFANVPGICLGINSYGGYPLFTITNWIDNIAINGSTAPLPGPPTMLQPIIPITGLNCIDTTPAAQYNRYHIVDSNDNSGGLSFVGQSSVTYSYTLKAFPPTNVAAAYSWQAHFFLVSGSDNTNTQTIYPDQYDQAADYNLANCVFVTIQSDGNGGGAMNFRYKTNEIGGNGMLFNTTSPTNTASNPNGWPIQPVCSMDDTNAILGTWTLTFANTTNVTLNGPGGMSTNFTLDPASAQLFADPCSILLGAQPNTAGYTNQDVVYSKFSLTGTSAAFSDDFETDPALNTNYWANFANDPAGLDLVPPGSAYWIAWTLPANSFSLYVATNLPATGQWTALASAKVIKSGGMDEALVSSSMLPHNGTNYNGYFAVISNSIAQLVVILPGQTFTPGVAPGYSGEPTAVSTAGGFGVEQVTVMAVDAHFNPVSGITDTIALSSATDGSPVLPTPAPMVNGSITFNNSNPFAFSAESTLTPETVTATDTSNTSIPAATSATVQVGP